MRVHWLLLVLAPFAVQAFGAGAPAPGPCDPIFRAMDAQLAQKGYRLRTSNLDPDSGKLRSTSWSEALPPDRIHDVNGSDEFIVIRGKGTFQKKEDGTWEKMLTDPPKMLLGFFTPGAKAHFEKKFKDCHKVKSETLDGKAMDVWQYSVSIFPASSVAQIWIGADGLPHRTQTDGKMLGVRSRSVQAIEYDSGIKIEPPAKFSLRAMP